MRKLYIVSCLILLALPLFATGQADPTVQIVEKEIIVRVDEDGQPFDTNPATGTILDRDIYYPGTESLGAGEMRVISLGTAMPNARMSQAATGWLVELGNGDKFIFDAGTGSDARFSTLGIPYDLANKIFLSHLHTDHFGDFISYYIGGWVGGRVRPLEVWGPSSSRGNWGTKFALEKIAEGLAWDIDGRSGRLPPKGGELIVHEFDYLGENEIIYEENGVVIRSWPAIHALDGPVSFGLEWNGLKFVFGGDTYPNKWFNEYARDADVAIHECFPTVDQLIGKMGFVPASAANVGTQIHTAPEAFGKIMSEVQPRMAIAYHFFNDWDTQSEIYSRVRKTYDGPLSLADDLMVWNVTEDEITVRQSKGNPDSWGEKSPFRPDPPPDVSQALVPGPAMMAGEWEEVEALNLELIKEAYDKYGLDFDPAAFR